MVFQVGFGGETFVANVARVGFFSSVSPLVDFEVVSVGKPLKANITLMRFPVLFFAMKFFCGILEY